MKIWRDWSSRARKGGFLIGSVVSILAAFVAFQEYQSCSPQWEGMCGGTMIFVSLVGLGLPLIFALPLAALSEDFLTPDTFNFLLDVGVIVGLFIEFSLIGAWVFHMLEKKKINTITIVSVLIVVILGVILIAI